MSTVFYALCQKSKASGKVYFRDFNNRVWRESIDENCLSSKKLFVEELGDKNWKGNYKILSFDLVARSTDCDESDPGIVVKEVIPPKDV